MIVQGDEHPRKSSCDPFRVTVAKPIQTVFDFRQEKIQCISRSDRDKSVPARASQVETTRGQPHGPLVPLDTCREGTPSDLWLNWLLLAGSSASSSTKKKQTWSFWDQSLQSCTRRPNAKQRFFFKIFFMCFESEASWLGKKQQKQQPSPVQVRLTG